MVSLDETLLGEIVRRLASEFDPDRMILFGSRAWGAPNEESDVDVLVIVPDEDARPTLRAARAYRALRGLLVPMDVLIRTRDEMARFGSVPASLEAEILERGKVIYGRGEEGTDPGLAHQSVA